MGLSLQTMQFLLASVINTPNTAWATSGPVQQISIANMNTHISNTMTDILSSKYNSFQTNSSTQKQLRIVYSMISDIKPQYVLIYDTCQLTKQNFHSIYINKNLYTYQLVSELGSIMLNESLSILFENKF